MSAARRALKKNLVRFRQAVFDKLLRGNPARALLNDSRRVAD